MRLKLIALLAFTTLLVACGTPYSRVSPLSPNGYSDVMLDSSRAIVTFTSYRSDRNEAVVRGALLRAAELAKENGFDAFAIVSDNASEQTSGYQTGGTYQAIRIGNQTFGSFNPGVPIILTKAEQRITVQFFKKEQVPAGAYIADDVINRNRASFK